jgi:short-subunit dehydrogenase
MENTNIAIITGASKGFGRIFAELIDKKLVNSIDEIWIIGRNEDELNDLCDNLKKDVRIFPMDLLDPESMDLILENLISENAKIKILVNAAGFGIAGEFMENSLKEVHDMVTLNSTVLTDLTKICLPYMGKDSRIVNFASVAAFIPQPEFAVYAASKSYVLSFSRALNEELRKKDIFVTAVCPGPARTNFFNTALKNSDGMKFKDYFMAEPSKVVEKAFKDAIAKKEVSVYSFSMNFLRFISKAVPHSIVIKIMGKVLKK